jgi:hypothetical protein
MLAPAPDRYPASLKNDAVPLPPYFYRWSSESAGHYWNTARTSPTTLKLFLRKYLTSRDSVIMSYRYTMTSRGFHCCKIKPPGNLLCLPFECPDTWLTHVTGPRRNNCTTDAFKFNSNTHKFCSLLVARKVLWRRVVMLVDVFRDGALRFPSLLVSQILLPQSWVPMCTYKVARKNTLIPSTLKIEVAGFFETLPTMY